MKFLPLLAALLAPLITADSTSLLTDSTTIYIQPVSASPSTSSSPPISPLAEISYNPSTLTSTLTSFSPPDLPSEEALLRIGLYDPSTSTWKSSTSLTSAANFIKGYSPIFVLTLDVHGAVIGASVKSGKIDAGQTRDFTPKVRLVKMGVGKGPELNRPVVLSPEGKLEEPEQEKTMLQKYWWVILGAVMLLLAGGGGE